MAIAASGYAKHVYRNTMARYKLIRRCRHSKDVGDLVTVDASRLCERTARCFITNA